MSYLTVGFRGIDHPLPSTTISFGPNFFFFTLCTKFCKVFLSPPLSPLCQKKFLTFVLKPSPVQPFTFLWSRDVNVLVLGLTHPFRSTSFFLGFQLFFYQCLLYPRLEGDMVWNVVLLLRVYFLLLSTTSLLLQTLDPPSRLLHSCATPLCPRPQLNEPKVKSWNRKFILNKLESSTLLNV